MKEPELQGDNWEKDTIQQLLLLNIKEQRAKRKWGIFFKLIGFGYILLITLMVLFGNDSRVNSKEYKGEHTALIEIDGTIGKTETANAENINQSLENAFLHKQTKGIILKINSPGGSPVQARQIYSNILRLKEKYKQIKVYAAIEDLGTSAAYLIASASDQIYADETSIVGSIGVIIDGFGFVDALNKLGVERRVYTAGKNKAMLDPFSPRNKEQEDFVNQQLSLVHSAFIKNVLDRRPQIVKNSTNPDHSHEEVFSGKFWVGQAALDLGLIDGFGDAQYIAREVIKVSYLKDFTLQANILDKLSSKLKLMIKNIPIAIRNIIIKQNIK